MGRRDQLSEDPLKSRDQDLVAAFLERRDEASFRALYRAHTPALYRFAVLRVGATAAEDVVQETWLRATRSLAGFQWKSTLRTWLTGIALNACRERFRKRGRLVAVPDPVPDEAAPEGPGVADLSALRSAISTLSDGYREVLLLHDVEGYTHEEIGELLGISPGTSKSQLHRARGRMRQALDTEEVSNG